MRRIEEEHLILAEIFLLIGITLTTIVIQYSYDRINQNSQDIIIIQNSINQLENLIGLSYLDTIRTDIIVSNNLSLREIQNITQIEYPNELINQLKLDFKSGKISQEKFLEEMKKYSADRRAKLENQRRDKYKELQILISNEPKCLKYSNCKRLINFSYIVQLISIILSFIIYYFIFKSINKRIAKT